jgi:3-hydroxyisobutyrate dehydrogenase
MSELAQKSRPIGNHRIGWIGAGGRMGFSMVRRLLAAGHQVAVFNRTRAKAQPLTMHGATIVDTVQCLGECTAVFATVANCEDLLNVTIGDDGLLRGRKTPRILVDCSSVSVEASSAVRDFASGQGVAMLAAPVSGNAKAMDAGDATIVVSGPRTAYEFARPYLNDLGRTVSYVGDGEQARVVKICHNLMLGVIAQCMAEISVLAESSGIPRSTLLEFINHSVMGSVFTRYKTPSFVNLDMAATFTSMLLRKDLDLGLDAASRRGVPLPLTELTRSMVQRAIDAGHGDADFASLLIEQARSAGIELEPEVAPVKSSAGN